MGTAKKFKMIGIDDKLRVATGNAARKMRHVLVFPTTCENLVVSFDLLEFSIRASVSVYVPVLKGNCTYQTVFEMPQADAIATMKSSMLCSIEDLIKLISSRIKNAQKLS